MKMQNISSNAIKCKVQQLYFQRNIYFLGAKALWFFFFFQEIYLLLSSRSSDK